MEIKLVGSTNNFIFSDQVLAPYIEQAENGFHYLNLSKIEPNLLNREELIKPILRFSQNFARICYSNKNWDGLVNEPYNSKLINRLVESGHHSIFEQATFN